MTTVIDLSQLMENNMPVYPGDAKTVLRQNRRLEIDGYNDHRLTTGMHAGTHIDGPMHLTASQDYISDIKIESFIGRGCLLDVRHQPIIGVKPEYLSLIAEESIVLLYTGFDQCYGQPQYYHSHPVVNDHLCQLFIDKKIKLLGMDTPSPDNAPFPIHKKLLANGIYCVENLTNLDKIPPGRNFEVIALPLNIRANGSMARVIASLE